MTGFAPSLVSPAMDPTKHVNYVLGMVLGVDDLAQEFDYLSQRDQWLARDAIGYGTLWGLAVSLRDGGARGLEVLVSSGAALSPRGQLIRVAPAQCAAFDEWLAGRGEDILARRIPTSDPNLFELPLWLVLSYRTCLTDPVPIAGEPCRTEDDSTAPSRVADDFLLSLQFDPPPQSEEDSIRAFAAWLASHISIAPGPASLTVAQFLDGIRAAAQGAVSSPPVSSPPASPPYLVDASPPLVLTCPPDALSQYVRAATRLWVTELRPSWRPNWFGDKHSCAGNGELADPDAGNQVLLAKLTLTVGPAGLNSSTFTVQGTPPVIDEEDRPFLLSLRLLQEALFNQGGSSPGAGPSNGAPVVAAGLIAADGTSNGRTAFGNPKVLSHVNSGGATQIRVGFDGYAQPPTNGGPQYVVKALPFFASPLSVAVAGLAADGFVLAVSNAGSPLSDADVGNLSLFVEVTQLS
ncbi:MAG TPA: hypothetical protein VGH20_21385 [Myxococcales bacterium]|jgi:hypothetical protein